MKKLRCFAGFTTIVVSSFIFLSFLFTSCEIGLGSAVDTQSPQLSVTSPKVDSVIRDKFAIKGTWEDDGSIKNLSAVLERTDGFGKPIKLKGVWETDETEKGRETGTGNWFVIIDPEDVDSKHNKLIDGTYQATVSITDNGNHVTTQSTTFTVDNTPPLLILKKPNSTPAAPGEEEKTLSVYGQTLYLEGSIADLTKQTWIQMDFYSDVSCSPENYLYTIETDSIAPTDVNQNNTKFAVYEEIINEDGTKKLVENDYSKIYNSNVKIGAVPVYAKLTIYDTAETIPLTAEEKGEEDGEETLDTPSKKGYIKGNRTQEFFISTDLARDLTKSEKNGGYGFAPIEMYNILNGTEDLKGESRSAQEIQKLTKEELKTLLASKSKKESVFSINPDNNPYFTISGLKTLSGSPRDFASSDGGYYIKNGSQTLEISVFMGSDSYELDTDSGDFYAYLLEFTFDKNGNLKYDDKEENRIKLYSKYKEVGTGADKKALYKIGGKEGHKTTTGAYVFAVPITKKLNTNTDEGSVEYDKLPGAKLVYGKNYLIRVNGKDVEGNPIDNESNRYGFRFSPSGTAPVVNISEPLKTIVYLKKGDNLDIKGSVSSEESGLIVSFYKENETEPLHTIPLAEPDNNSNSSFEWTVPADTFAQDNSDHYTISVKVAGQEAASSPVVRTVYYDVDGPTVIINKEQPVVEKIVTENGQQKILRCINGDFYLEGIFDDDFDVFDSASFEIIQKDDSGKDVVKQSGVLPKKFTSETSKVSTTALTDQKEVIYKITAQDRAGNKTIKEYEYFVDQSADIPVISNNTLKLDATTYADIKKDGKDFYNMFQRSSNLILYVEDDDGIIANVTVDMQNYKSLSNGDLQEGESEQTKTFEGQNVIQYQLPDKTGIFKATVVATDIYGAQGTVSFFLKITGNGPDVRIEPVNDYISTKGANGGTFVLNFNISDEGNKPYTIYYGDENDAPELKQEDGISVSDDGNTITYIGTHVHYAQNTVNASVEERKSEIFTIRDVNNVATVKTFYPKFDNESPTINFDEGGYPDIKRTGEDTFYFKGKCSDLGSGIDEPSKVKEVKIGFAHGNDKAEPDTGWLDAILAGSSWSYEAEWLSDELKAVFWDSNTKRFREGGKTVLIKAIDNAGNETITTQNFTYDRSVPEITAVTGQEYTNKNAIELKITVKDTNPDSLNFKLYEEDVEQTLDMDAVSFTTVSETWNDETGVCTVIKTVTIPFPQKQDKDEQGNPIGQPHYEDGTYAVEITAIDANNRTSAVKTKQIIRDTENPELDNILVKTNSTKNNVYNPSETKNYYVNNIGQKFTISGISQDNIGIEKVELLINKVKTDDTTDDSVKIERNPVSNPVWSFINLDMSGEDWTAADSKGAEAKITVTDKAGNTYTETLNIIFDVTAPSADHKIDDSLKNLEFRIGDAPNDLGKAGSLDPKDLDVGGKYSNGSFGSSQTIDIRGNFPDNKDGSGIKKFYYKTFNNLEVTIDPDKENESKADGKIYFQTLDKLREYVIENKTDVFSPLDSVETKNVEYNMNPADPVADTEGRFGGSPVNGYTVNSKGYVQFRTSVDTNFKTTLKGFVEGKNYLVIVAEDNVGNAAVDSAEVEGVTYPCYALNVDITAPTIPTKHNGIVYTNVVKALEENEPNPSAKVIISGTASDKPNSNVDNASSGVSSIVFTSDQNNEKVTVSTWKEEAAENDPDPTLKTWEVDIRPLLKEEGTAIISAMVTDVAGYSTTVPVATIIIDQSAPVVSINTPSDADRNTEGVQINGTISLSGSAQDNSGGCGLKEEANGSKTIALYYTTNETLGTKTADTIQASDVKTSESDTATAAEKFVPVSTIANTFSWEFTNIDTTSLGVEDGTPVYFMVSTQDKAGNTGYSAPMAVIVDQDTDRPIISLTNLVLATTPGRTSFLKGSSKLEGTISDDDGNVKNLWYSKDGTSFTEITLQYGSAWSIPNLEDGEKTIYFKITDAKNTTFTTVVPNENTPTMAPGQPKIKDESANNTYVTHTNGSLALNFMVVTKKPEVKDITYQVKNNVTGEWETRTTIGTLGGIYTKFKISLDAKAVSSIRKVEAVYNNETKVFTCAQTEHNDKEFHTWNLPEEFDLDDSVNEIKLIISDASSEEDPMQTEDTISFSIDNTSPTIRIKDPSPTVGVKETMQFDMSEAATAYYAVTLNTVNEAPTNTSVWTEIIDNSNGLTRYVFFDDDTGTQAKDHTDRFAIYLTEKYLNITTLEAIERAVNPYETITTVTFWAKAVDSCGNIGYACKAVNVDPQGNRPYVTLKYPLNVLKKNSTTEYEPPTLGGTIRIDGNVTDDIAAKYVWIQIERDDQAFSLADLQFLREKGYEIGNMLTNNLLTDSDWLDLQASDVPDCAIRVPVSGTSWNLSINQNLEFNKVKVNPTDSTIANCKLIIYATDADPDKINASIHHIHRSAAVMQEFKIDSANPYINVAEMHLVKYNSDGTTANKVYKEGSSVDGIWYLQGKICDDDSGLKNVQYKYEGDADFTKVIENSGETKESINNDAHFYFRKVAHQTDAQMFDYEFSVPLGNNSAGIVGTDKITIMAVENTDQNLSVSQSFSVTFDNKAPVINTDPDNSFVKLSQNIYNENGFYTFGAIASEDTVTIGGVDVNQSGVERIAFYFTRDLDYSLNTLSTETYSLHTGEKDSKTNDIFDVMIYRDGKDSEDVNSGNMIINYKGKKDSGDLKYSEGLYWRTHTGSASGTSAFTYTGSVDPNIHAGGLVKINGVIYKIESVNGNIVNLPSEIGSASSADFALCNVIDHGGEKNGRATSTTHGYGFGYYTGTRPTDDGDLITETFTKQGTDWIFDASINSRNLPDGPITLHIIAFDAAGNYNIDETSLEPKPITVIGTVQNNAPRIAGLILGTDENGDGNVTGSEFINAYSQKFTKGYDTSGNEIHDVSFPIVPDGETPQPLLTLKGVTVVQPEIIGGNGAITYGYKVYTKNPSTNRWNTTPKLTKDGGALTDSTTTEGIIGKTDAVSTGSITIPVSDFIGTTSDQDTNEIPDGDITFEFTFGDTTPGLTSDTAIKNNATLSIYVDVNLREENKAQNWILPFYWKSSDENSLFGQSKDNGHIELKSDLTGITAFAAASGEFDTDPKVSGKIKLEGIARDDTLLRDIKVQFGKTMGGLGTSNTTIASYDAANTTWTTTALENDGSINPTTGWASAVQQATYQDLLDVGIITSIPADTEPSAKIPYTSQDYGHVVHWILYLDTSKVQNIAATDVTATATATDRGKPKWDGTGVAYTENSAQITGAASQYQFDVVPYIAGIETQLSSNLKSSIKNAYSRTALGHYIARSDETIVIKGFNLGYGAIKPKYGENELTINGNGNVELPANLMATSGAVSLTVSDIETLNNNNNNNACGSYAAGITESSLYNEKNTYAYNRMPNRTSNNLLTDDVVIDIWQFDNDAAKPMSGELREPSMKINPVTGQVGLAFVSGPADIAMADSTSNLSYSQWQNCYATFNNISFTYDANGYAHATATGLDTNPKANEKHAGRFSYFYNKWSHSGLDPDGNYNGVNAIRLESIAVPMQTATTVFTHSNTYNSEDMDNYNNGQTIYEKIVSHPLVAKGAVMENDILTETRFYSPSLAATVHGNSTAVYLAYYDSIQNQIRFRYNSELPDTKEDKDDFVDNEGYRAINKAGDAKAYQEAYTTRFSIIAGIDYQQGEETVVPSNDYRYVNVAGTNKTDDQGNLLYPMIYRRAKTENGTVIIDNKKTAEYKIQNVTLTADHINKLHESLKGRFSLGQSVKGLVNSTGSQYWWIVQDDGLINMCPISANNVPPGSYSHIISSRSFSDPDVNIDVGYSTDRYIDGEVFDIWYERITTANEGDQIYYSYYDDAPEYFFPVPSKNPSQAQIPVYIGNQFKCGYDTGVNAYKYVAIDAKTGNSAAEDIVVAVWHDGTGLRYAYTDNPTNGKDNNIANNNLDENNKGWKGNKVIFSEGGEYCTVKIDPLGRIHIAAYADGSLRYAYLSSYDATNYNELTDSVVVDSFTITGERINLDVGLEQVGNTSTYVAVPYISYYNGTARKPTMAKLVIPANGVMNYKAQGTGTDDGSDLFTGNWEISLVPTDSILTSQYYDRMNIALWKHDGKIVESTNDCFTITGQNGKITSVNNVSYNSGGNIYGNGTANPILGYAVESLSGTYFETAQMK